MNEKNENPESVICIFCPICRSRVWVDSRTRKVIKTEKSPKIKENLDELLRKEHLKKTRMENKFASTAAVAKEKKKQAEDKFSQAFSKFNKSDQIE